MAVAQSLEAAGKPLRVVKDRSKRVIWERGPPADYYKNEKRDESGSIKDVPLRHAFMALNGTNLREEDMHRLRGSTMDVKNETHALFTGPDFEAMGAIKAQKVSNVTEQSY